MTRQIIHLSAILLLSFCGSTARAHNSRQATASAYIDRGDAWMTKGDLNRAIADFDLAVASESSSAGLVRIVACCANEWLELLVQDDGKGLPNDRELAQGIGLGNARKRLAQLYGERNEV